MNKKMNALFFTVTTFILFGCGSTSLAPINERTVEYIEKTTLSKSMNYLKVLSYISKNFGDSNKAIRAKDKDSGTIILKGNIACNIFRQFGDVNNYNLSFNLTVNSKDKKVRLLFEDLQIVDRLGKQVGWDYNQLTSRDKINESKLCLLPLKKGILGSINESNSNW